MHPPWGGPTGQAATPAECGRLQVRSTRLGRSTVVAQGTYSPIPNVKNIHPDILMESSSHQEKEVEENKRVMSELGGKVVITPYYPMICSTDIKKKIREG